MSFVLILPDKVDLAYFVESPKSETKSDRDLPLPSSVSSLPPEVCFAVRLR